MKDRFGSVYFFHRQNVINWRAAVLTPRRALRTRLVLALVLFPISLAAQTQTIPQYQAIFDGDAIKIRPVVPANPNGFTYSVVTSPPTSFWDSSSGVWSWTTTYRDIGPHLVTFRATSVSEPTEVVDVTTQINVYPNMAPPRWKKYDPMHDGRAHAVFSAQPSSWEFDAVRDPALAVYADTGMPYLNSNGEYMMYYTGGSSAGGSYQVGLATSRDLLNWARSTSNPVLRKTAPPAWDSGNVIPGSVTVMPDGTFRMYYSATRSGEGSYRVGLATSPDGVVWTRDQRDPQNPGLVLDIGPGGIDHFIALPVAIKISSTTWLMYLEASGSDQVNFFFCGLAVSNDNGMTWAKAPANEYYALVSSAGEWDAQGVANPKPMKLGENMYILGYDGESEIALSNMKLGIAIGFDGKHWTKYSGNPILSGDGQGVGDGNRIENALFLRSDFGQPRMNLLYFGGEASPPTNFKIFVSILEADRPPTTGNPCLTRGTVYQDFVSPVGISNDISPLASPCAAASISPYGSINIAAPAYTWKADPVATEYRLIVRDESGTALLDEWYSTGSICASSNVCAVKPTLTLADGSYTWQTQARNSVGYGPPGGRTGFVVQSTIQRAKILWQNDQTGELRAWFMDGATQVGEVSLTPTVVLPTDWKIPGVGRFDGDGKTHLVWRLLTTGNNGIWFMDGVSQTSIGALPILETAWQLVATDDFNSDGKTDIVWRSTSGSNRIWYMSHAVVLGTVDLTPVPGQDWDILGAGDFNGDGHPDLVWLYKPTGAIALWYMNDSQQLATALVVSGQTGQPETLGASSAWRVFSVADFNGDGNLDLFWWQAGTGGTGVWLMNGATHTGTVGLRAEPDSHWRPVAYLPGSGR